MGQVVISGRPSVKVAIESILTMRGDILHHNGTEVVRLPIGSDNQIARVATDILAYELDPETLIVRKTVDEDIASQTTLHNDSDFLVPMAANEIWLIVLYLRLEGISTGGFKVAWSFPTGTTSGASIALYQDDNQGAGAVSGQSVFNIKATTGMVNDAVDRDQAIYQVVALNGANAGNVQFQWAQKTSNVTDTTVRANSVMIAHRIG